MGLFSPAAVRLERSSFCFESASLETDRKMHPQILPAEHWMKNPSTPTRAALLLALSAALSVSGFGQQTPPEPPLDVTGKLRFHASNVYSPLSMVGIAAYAGILQADNAPREWGQGASAYGQRFGSTLAWSGIRNTLAFGLTSTLRQDPRYFRAGSGGCWRRTGHAVRGTILTRTDKGGETFSTWRFGSAYGAAFLSNQWYPDRLNTTRLGFIYGSATIGLDMVRNLGLEFWPDIRKKVFRK